MSSTRWLIATVVGVILVAVAAVVVSSVREPAVLPEGTPEATVQRYLQAVADGDREDVLETYTPDLRRRCEGEQGPEPRPPLPEERMSFDADLLEVRELDGDRADVEVRISEFSGEPPFGGGGYDHTEVLRVERVDGGWGIADASWPYYVCPG